MVRELTTKSARQIASLLTEAAGVAVILTGIVRADLAWVTTGAGMLGAPALVPDQPKKEEGTADE